MTPSNAASLHDSASHPARPGRPRDPRRSKAILDAAGSLLAEGGWDALTIEAVAKRAGVGRPTVYRRWPTKGHLAAEILGAELADEASGGPIEAELPDTGSLVGDLTVLATGLRDLLVALGDRGLHPGLIAEMALDTDLATQMRLLVSIPDRDRVAVVIERAIERGEARPDLDPAFVVDSLAALVTYFLFLVHEPVGEAEVARIVDLVARGCLAPRSADR